MDEVFRDRREAGVQVASLLAGYRGRRDVVVLGLPRGGVPVAFDIAKALAVPLDVMVVRKLGVPGYEELAMGAIATGGVRVLHEEVVRQAGITPDMLAAVSAREQQELARRERVFAGGRPEVEIRGRTVILVDDGLATGSTMRAAVAAARQRGAARVIVAVPVASAEACDELRAEADEVICARTPALFFGVGQWYERFEQTTDEEVRRLLADAAALPPWKEDAA
ncbi:phosphoribosyltransferase [Nitrospira moscoviensis]|uniref:Phosphoribosyltransferase n=1 Tax=Nitrospira moscoviensis TaxID=42253 RepID=A0A0K2GED1_NITMO|nr:phosphoribosyltransferase [Nitrospira moscoviensis]ALA59219.1 Phosphoribosyltransferase [Nitrospira moscoviensis]